jgi:hypothetical protein
MVDDYFSGISSKKPGAFPVYSDEERPEKLRKDPRIKNALDGRCNLCRKNLGGCSCQRSSKRVL